MKTIDIVGYLAAGLVLATFCTRSMNRLRLIALVSNFAFITYGYLANLAPVLILHSVLLPVNAYRLVQLCWAEPATKLVAIFRVHSIAAHAIIVFVLVFALAGGEYKLFTYFSQTADVTARVTVAAAAGHLKALGLPKSSAAALGTPVNVAADIKTAVDAAPGREPSPASRFKDAKFYRERGVALCRSGDFSLAIADFDQAIRLDPNSETAYVDRGIALYRMGELGRAFADIVRAKRMENSRQAATLPSKPRKARSSLDETRGGEF